MYFECNLPKKVPTFYEPGLYGRLQSCVDKVYARTAFLNEACDKMEKMGVRPATFHALAKKVFDNGAEHFDGLTVAELITLVNLLNTGVEYPDRIEWPNVDVLFDTAFVTIPEWELLRHVGIGGSDSSVLMGVSPYQTEEGLWYEKLGYPELVPDDDRQAIFDRGHFMEDKVIEAFCHMTGAERIPETRMFRSRKHPCATANPDSVLRMPSSKLALFEAKSAMDVYSKVSEWFGSNVPPNYTSQTHHYIAVFDDERIDGCYIGMIPCKDMVIGGVYCGSDFDSDRYYHSFIAPDPIYEDELMAEEEYFWEHHVVAGVKPQRSMNAELDKKVAETYTATPKSDPDAAPVELSYDRHKETLEQLMKVEEEVSRANKQLEDLKNFRDGLRIEFLGLIGAAQEATFTDADGAPKIIVKNTLVKKVGIDSKLLKQIDAELYEKCAKPRVETRFSIKAAKVKAKT